MESDIMKEKVGFLFFYLILEKQKENQSTVIIKMQMSDGINCN